MSETNYVAYDVCAFGGQSQFVPIDPVPVAGKAEEMPPDQGCKVPPPGWYCSREPGHAGPCAARPTGREMPEWVAMQVTFASTDRPVGGATRWLAADRERLQSALDRAEGERNNALERTKRMLAELQGERRAHEILVSLRRNQMLATAALQKERDAMAKLVHEAIGWDEEMVDGEQLSVAVREYRAKLPQHGGEVKP